MNNKEAVEAAHQGYIHLEKQNWREALKCFLKAFSLDYITAEYADKAALACYIIGYGYKEKGDFLSAEEFYTRALSLNPSMFEIFIKKFFLYYDHGRFDEAIKALKYAEFINKYDYDTILNLSMIYLRIEDDDNAIKYLLKVESINPSHIIYYNLGNVYKRQNRFDLSEIAYLKSLAMQPNYYVSAFNLALLYFKKNMHYIALQWSDRAKVLTPDDEWLYLLAGDIHRENMRLTEAKNNYFRAIELNHDLQDAHLHLSQCHFLEGDYTKAFSEFEWFWEQKDKRGKSVLPQGVDLKGKKILIGAWWGFGDTIFVSRFFPELIRRGAAPILEDFTLREILAKNISGCQHCVLNSTYPDYDYNCPAMLLPGRLGIYPENAPEFTPYINTDSSLSKGFRQALCGVHGLKAGICWGSVDPLRALKLEDFRELAELPGIVFLCLQKGGREDFLKTFPKERVFDIGHEIDAGTPPFMETAALIDNLDLIITSDTSIAHLAGAMGKPVWVMTTFLPYWIWGLSTSTSPWYPSLRLFRQSKRCEWRDVFREVKAALEELLISLKK